MAFLSQPNTLYIQGVSRVNSNNASQFRYVDAHSGFGDYFIHYQSDITINIFGDPSPNLTGYELDTAQLITTAMYRYDNGDVDEITITLDPENNLFRTVLGSFKMDQVMYPENDGTYVPYQIKYQRLYQAQHRQWDDATRQFINDALAVDIQFDDTMTAIACDTACITAELLVGFPKLHHMITIKCVDGQFIIYPYTYNKLSDLTHSLLVVNNWPNSNIITLDYNINIIQSLFKIYFGRYLYILDIINHPQFNNDILTIYHHVSDYIGMGMFTDYFNTLINLDSYQQLID